MTTTYGAITLSAIRMTPKMPLELTATTSGDDNNQIGGHAPPPAIP
ncbi:MAG: hypothetical protein IKP00_13350 [Victivallales bacterium]|nr:hypothetical protein [Victivallales bacterium]